jgi:hypothetical protein
MASSSSTPVSLKRVGLKRWWWPSPHPSLHPPHIRSDRHGSSLDYHGSILHRGEGEHVCPVCPTTYLFFPVTSLICELSPLRLATSPDPASSALRTNSLASASTSTPHLALFSILSTIGIWWALDWLAWHGKWPDRPCLGHRLGTKPIKPCFGHKLRFIPQKKRSSRDFGGRFGSVRPGLLWR